MASRVEILDRMGFRSDGRKQFELRDITINLSSPQGEADGSVTLSHGLTQVAVWVFGPREAKMRSQTIHDRANINVDVNIASFSLGEWRRSRADRRTLELASTIKSTFEQVVQTNLYPRSQIDVFVLILQQDGGLLQACINATALAIACAGIPLLDLISAVTIGVHATSALLDLTLLEENDTPNLTFAVMARTGKITLLTMETRLHADRFNGVIALAIDACRVIHNEMKEALRAKADALVNVTRTPGEDDRAANEHTADRPRVALWRIPFEDHKNAREFELLDMPRDI